jgi:hypothetical protein
MVETDRAAYLIRQYLANDLYDRIRYVLHHSELGVCRA